MSAEIGLPEVRMGTEHFIRTCTFQKTDCLRWTHCLGQYCNHMYVIRHHSQFYYRYSVSFCNGPYVSSHSPHNEIPFSGSHTCISCTTAGAFRLFRLNAHRAQGSYFHSSHYPYGTRLGGLTAALETNSKIRDNKLCLFHPMRKRMWFSQTCINK